MSLIYLFRHGQTDWNRIHRFQGHTDIPLNAMGKAQADRLADSTATLDIRAIYSSDLKRAYATAQPMAEQRGLTITTDVALRERSYGQFEGLTVEEIEVQFPEERKRWARHDPDYAIPDGESLVACRARVMPTLNAIAARHDGQPVAVFTHGGILDIVFRSLVGAALGPPRFCDIPNAVINVVAFRPTPQVIVWGMAV